MAEETMYDRIMLKLRERGETPGFMCNSLGLRRAMISDLKSGKNRELSAGNLAIIARYLRCTTDYLITGRDVFASLPEEEIGLLNAWRLASEDERENVAFILRKHFTYLPNTKPEQEKKMA